MGQFPRPPEGTWTEHHPELGTGLVSYEDCISPELHELEREAVFRRSWLNVCRVEEVAQPGRFVTRELEVLDTSIVIARDGDDQIRAFRRTSRGARPDRDRNELDPLPVHCDVWAGFVFVNLAERPDQTLPDFLGPMIGALGAYPFDRLPERYDFRAHIACNWKVFADAFQEYYHVPMLHSQESTVATRAEIQRIGFEAPHYQLDGPHRMVSTSGAPRRKWPAEYQYPIEIATRSGLFGPWDEPDLGDDLPGVNPGGIPKWGMSNFQIFPNTEILIWETGWYMHYRYWPTAYNTHRFEGSLFFAPSRKASDRAARECAAVMFKEFALQDAGTLEGTQQALESRAVTTGFPLCDQEILVRHLHHEVAQRVEAHRRERQAIAAGA